MVDINSIDFNVHFKYDESSPSCLVWKEERRCGRGNGRVLKSVGDVVGHFHTSGYHVVDLNYKIWKCHRVIMVMNGVHLGEGDYIDHVDGDRGNNKFSNLRVVGREANCRNTRKSDRNVSGVTGVSFSTIRDGTTFWTACWQDKVGKGSKTKQKRYRVSVHGHDAAFKLACDYRAMKIEELNLAGAGYTDRHGI